MTYRTDLRYSRGCPRKPRDDAERLATRSGNGARECSAYAPARLSHWACTLNEGHAGDHIATDGECVLARWKRRKRDPVTDQGGGEG